MTGSPAADHRRGGFRWRRFAWAFAAALLLNALSLPALLDPLRALTKKDELEIAFVEEAPSADAPPTELVVPPPAPKAKPPEPRAKAPEPAKLAELPPAPEPPKVPVPPTPPQPVVLDKRKQSVDQDKFEEEKDNADAKYLAQKNHHVAEDTREESTNLIREAQGAKAKSAPSENQDPNAGEREQKIAELENRKGTDLPREAPQRGNEGKSPDKRPTVPGPLAMRNLVPRTTERTEIQRREGLERQELEAGDLPMQRRGQDGERGGASKKGGEQVKLTLDHHAYDNIEGFATAERERREAARAERSHVRGRYDRYLDKVAVLHSALENFTPDVRVGNQAELGTRASPFAAYITAMHRQIHKIWTFGFLADQDGRLGGGAFSDETLWTQLQISLKADGSVDKLGVVHASGNVAFDAAAIDSVMSAAPFPKPPAAIKSANGKVYLDWQFHRDERACGTFGVDPHILTTPDEAIQHDVSEVGAGAVPRPPNAKPVVAAPRSPPSEDEGPRRLQRKPAEAAAGGDGVPSVTDEVKTTAEGWIAAWARGDVAWLAGWSATPFVANGQISAKTPEALRAMYKQMLGEVTDRKGGPVEILTPGGMRAKTGGLPPGGQESGMLFAAMDVGGERFVLLLRLSDHGWRVAGLVR